MARNQSAERAQLVTLLSSTPSTLPVFVETHGQVQLVATGPGALDRATIILAPRRNHDLLQHAPLDWWKTPASMAELFTALDNCWISIPDELLNEQQGGAPAPLTGGSSIEVHEIVDWCSSTEPDLSEIGKARVYYDTALQELRISQNGGAYVSFLSGGAPVAGAAGWIYITDVVGQGPVVVSNKTYQDTGNTVLQSCAASGGGISVAVKSSFPLVNVNGVIAVLTRAVDQGHFEGNVLLTLPASSTIVAQVTTPDGDPGSTDQASVTLVAAPELLSLSFVGGYPGSQTELKAGDTFQITGTTDSLADAIEIQNFGASDSVQLLTFPLGTSFTVTMTIGDQGTIPQLLSARARARDNVGAFGSIRDTNQGGGGVNGTDLVNLNNLFPSFVDGGTGFPPTQTAFKNVEAGTQTTTVNDFDLVAYADPTGTNFSITSPGTYTPVKNITCLNPGVYNDSIDNFRITATRNANAAVSVFLKQIEVADIAPVITVTQPQARLRSGGNDGTAVQSYLITATSNQNLAAIPDIGVGVDGTFTGGGFVGGPTVFTRSINIDDTQLKGSGAWVLLSAVNNNAGIPAAITGLQVNGGFVARDLTYAAFATSTVMNVEVVDFSKLTAVEFTATAQLPIKQIIGTPPSVTDGYTIDALNINPTAVTWLDSPAASSNSSGTAQITGVEETV